MEDGIGRGGNARIAKGLALACVGLLVVSLVLVHGESYRPAVSYVPVYVISCVVFTVSVALRLLPARQFGEGFCAAAYALYAVLFAAATFFTGGVSSELYVLFFPLLFASALHGSWRIVLLVLGAVLLSYALAMLPNALRGAGSDDGAPLVFFRLAVFAVGGVFARYFVAGVGEGEAVGGEYVADEDGSVLLLERVEEGIRGRGAGPVAVVLVDPGRLAGGDLDLLMERMHARIEAPVLLGEGEVFGMVLRDADERAAESAARRALAAAGSLGAGETRAGAAVYPHDARSSEDLLVAAGRALEAAFAVESPSAIVLAGRRQDSPGPPSTAAR